MSSLKWLPALRDKLEQLCANWRVPLGVVVGWIEVESGGRVSETTKLREYGIFQIHPEESADLGFDHERIHHDAAYGLECGFRLVDHYRKVSWRFLSDAGARLEQGSETHWRMAKFCHSIGSGAARACIAGAQLKASSWDRFAEYLRMNGDALYKRLRHDPRKWLALVDRCFVVGAPYSVDSLVCK